MTLKNKKISFTILICLMLVSIFKIPGTRSTQAAKSDSGDILWKGNVIVHRGYYTAPQNSLQSILEAKKKGFTMCEVDPRRSADGVIIMNHDETFVSDGKRYVIEDTDSDELLSLKNGNERFPDAGLCTLEEMLELCNLTGMSLKIDQKIKSADFEKTVAGTVMRYGLQEQCIFTCADVTYAQAVKSIYETAACSVNYKKLESETALDKYTAYSDMYVEIPVSEIDDDSLKILESEAERGYKIYVYNVSHQDIERAMLAHPYHIEPASGEEKYDFYKLIGEYAKDKYSKLEWD